ncbi:hypothetical protein LPJ75_001534, partial [Coemansia sp. RSA 2598]
MHRLSAPANCTEIDRLSAECAGLAYATQQSSQHVYAGGQPDALVTYLSHQITSALPRHAQRQKPRCRESIRTLSCSIVYPSCDETPGQAGLAHFSELLNGVGSSCGVYSEELADRLVRSSGCLGGRVVGADAWDAAVDGG